MVSNQRHTCLGQKLMSSFLRVNKLPEPFLSTAAAIFLPNLIRLYENGPRSPFLYFLLLLYTSSCKHSRVVNFVERVNLSDLYFSSNGKEKKEGNDANRIQFCGNVGLNRIPCKGHFVRLGEENELNFS